jgi:CMP-N,N'-diacetyllegionaminic acid synthase
MDVLGLIPARGGSKGIPRKNLAPVAGKSLLAWTVEAARGAQSLSRVVVSTDDDEIAAAADADVLSRPPELAADETPMIDVIRHAIDELEPEVVVLLQPTSPLRRSEHVDGAVTLLLETGADCVVSVCEVPHRYAPDALMELVDGRLVAHGTTRSRQEKGVVYARNGPAVLALRAGRLGRDLYDGDCRPYVMDQRSSLDVDTPFELELADLLLRSR